MPTFNIRLATQQDVPEIAAFNIAMAKETELIELPRERLESGVSRALARSDVQYLVAQVDDDHRNLAGSLMVTQEWSDWRDGLFWWIQSVYVAPTFRRQGVYRLLHSEVEARARRTEDVIGIRLYVEQENTQAQQTYHQLGMRTTDYLLFETDFTNG